MLTDTLSQLLAAAHRDDRDTTALLVAADCAAECDEPRVEWVLRILAGAGIVNRCATGSRAYGVPKPDSDYDWVLRTFDAPERQALLDNCDPDRSSGSTVQPEYAGAVPFRLSGSYRYGPINLIRVDTQPQFDVWFRGTAELCLDRIHSGPRTRQQAIDVFTALAARRQNVSETSENL